MEIARLVSWCIDRDLIVRECVKHIHERLGKRARCYFLEDGELVIAGWAGDHADDLSVNRRCIKESIVWKVFRRGIAVNLTDRSSAEGCQHTLGEEVKIKAIIPLRYVEALTQQEKKFGVLVVDSGKPQFPIPEEDFEYLQTLGNLIGETVGKAELVHQLINSYEKKEEMARTVAHCFRNRLIVIGGFAKRIERLSRIGPLKRYGQIVSAEIKELEMELERLEGIWKTSEERDAGSCRKVNLSTPRPEGREFVERRYRRT